MRDGDLRAAMGEAGRRRFETHFQAERMARDYAAFWQELRMTNSLERMR